MAESIGHFRIYKQARAAEGKNCELVKTLPADHFFGLGNDVRRTSAAVSHYLMEVHRLFSYRLKLDAIAGARQEAEATIKHLAATTDQDLGSTAELIEQYTHIIKQSWGLTAWLKDKLEQRQQAAEAVQESQ